MYEQNKWYVRINTFYKKGYYTDDDVITFVPHYISEEECYKILEK